MSEFPDWTGLEQEQEQQQGQQYGRGGSRGEDGEAKPLFADKILMPNPKYEYTITIKYHFGKRIKFAKLTKNVLSLP